MPDTTPAPENFVVGTFPGFLAVAIFLAYPRPNATIYILPPPMATKCLDITWHSHTQAYLQPLSTRVLHHSFPAWSTTMTARKKQKHASGSEDATMLPVPMTPKRGNSSPRGGCSGEAQLEFDEKVFITLKFTVKSKNNVFEDFLVMVIQWLETIQPW